MLVHIITYRWREPEEDGAEILNVFLDYQDAVERMREIATDIAADRARSFSIDQWDPDFTQDDETLISRGVYGAGYESDKTWSWELVTMEVE